MSFDIKKASIKEISPDTLSQIIKMADDYLGKEDNFLKDLQENEATLFYLEQDAKVKAFSASFIAQNSENNIAQKATGNKASNLIFPCGIHYAIAINDDFRKKGLSELLPKKAEEYFISNGVKSAIATAWEYNGIIPAKKSLEKLNYTELEAIKTPWKEDCDSGERKCPHRDLINHKCICNAIVYYKEFSK